jgi:O-acetyl-ADP-ribose deacetylase (regulator of RNase III)
METRNGNLIDAFEAKEIPAILHGVNCQNTMGSGIALEIKKRLPEAFLSYVDFCRSHPIPVNRLGRICAGETEYGPVFNVFTQLNFGKDGRRYVNYEAIVQGLESVAVEMKEMGLNKIGIPFLFGAARGGGSWPIIEQIVKILLDEQGIEVIYYSYGY